MITNTEIQITKIPKYKIQIFWNTLYRNTEIQITEIQKYKLQKYRYTNDRHTEIQVKKFTHNPKGLPFSSKVCP